MTAELPRDTDPNLLHYMSKKSYQKAMLFLQGRESEMLKTMAAMSKLARFSPLSHGGRYYCGDCHSAGGGRV
jgi:hypothetical protein